MARDLHGHNGRPANDADRAEDVRLAAAGDRDALRRVWLVNRNWLAALVLAHKPKRVELEDLMQDIATTITRRIDAVRMPEAFPGWLRQVAINACRTSGRRLSIRRTETLNEYGLADDSTDLSPDLKRVLDAAMSLPDGYREPLILKSVRNMTCKQIARALELPETTIETRIARARRMVRDMLAQDVHATTSGRTAT